jgi:hypothetical protein
MTEAAGNEADDARASDAELDAILEGWKGCAMASSRANCMTPAW